jgi:hypothetical protein
VNRNHWAGAIVKRPDADALNNRLGIIVRRVNEKVNEFFEAKQPIDVDAIRSYIYNNSTVNVDKNGLVAWIEKEIPLLKPKTTGVKLAKAAGIGVDELYDWYFRGKGGDEKYEEFSQIFEMVFILPRVMVMNKGKTMGIDSKVLLKRLKKDIGSADFKIWQENDVLNMEMSCININDDDAIDAEKVIRMLRKSKLFNVKSIDEDSNSFKLIKKSFKEKSNALFNVSVIDKSKFEEAIVR